MRGCDRILTTWSAMGLHRTCRYRFPAAPSSGRRVVAPSPARRCVGLWRKMISVFSLLAFVSFLMGAAVVSFAQSTSPAITNPATSRPGDEPKAGITLRKALHPGIENYHVQATVIQTIMAQQAAISSATAYTYNIGAVESTGRAPVKMTAKVERFDMDPRLSAGVTSESPGGTVGVLSLLQSGGMAAVQDNLLVTPAFGTIDSRNRFTVDPNEKVGVKAYVFGGEIANLFRPYVEFPEREVGTGDSWDITLPNDPWTTLEDQKLTATFLGDSKTGGDFYALSLTGSLKITTNIVKLLPAAARTTFSALTGNIDVSGEASVDKATGQIASMTLRLISKETAGIVFGAESMSPGASTVKITRDN
jgi:hypothetical protein